MAKNLKIGDKAPDFTLPRDGGGDVTLSALKGGAVIVYFYPKDNTPGCTKQAINFTEKLDAFTELGAQIIGISADSVKKHDGFKSKHKLQIILAADEDKKTIDDYGVWVEKSLYGRKFMGIERATFLIDGDGDIQHIWRKVRVKGHIEDVLERLKSL